MWETPSKVGECLSGCQVGLRGVLADGSQGASQPSRPFAALPWLTLQGRFSLWPAFHSLFQNFSTTFLLYGKPQKAHGLAFLQVVPGNSVNLQSQLLTSRWVEMSQ